MGGASTYVDTQDVAVRANQLAPGRFTWSKYRDQINLEVIRVYLSDAKKPQKGALLAGSGSQGWMLTEKGHQFSERRVQLLETAGLSRDPLSARERQWVRAERARILSDEAYVKATTTGIESVSRREAQALFRVDDYVLGAARERKIVRIVNTFGNDAEIGATVRQLALKAREEGNHDGRQ